jgi:S1-C subfamily serine protease
MNHDEIPLADAAPVPSNAEIPMAQPVVVRPSVPARIGFSLWHFVLPMLFLSSLCLLLLYLAPYLLFHWKTMDAHAEAEVSFTRRRAELKAEAEHADARLEWLDKKVNLTSLGFRELARKVLPMVVNVVNYRDPTDAELERAKENKLYLSYDSDNDRYYVQQSVGSGLIYKPGIVLTNDHVIRKASRLRVSFPSGRSIALDIEAAVGDERTDLAVIRLPEKLSTALKEESQNSVVFADSDKDVQVGDWVLAMGSQLGLKHTVSHGIISAKGRLVLTKNRTQPEDAMELLQTDAAIFPGNSGGPLFDQFGRVVGVNAMIATETGGNQGIGFAIPANTAKRVAEHLLAKGEVPRARLGVFMKEISAQEAKKLKIDGGGILVSKLDAGGAAEKAGIKPGDVIVRINKDAIQRYNPTRHLRQILGDLDPGVEITVEVVRGDERREILLTLGEAPPGTR